MMRMILWLNQYSAVLMLLVTIIYVIATIFIYKANSQSVKMANQQIIEMRRQYADEKKMKLMPYFIVNIIQETTQVNGIDICYLEKIEDKELELLSMDLYFELKNLGHDIAKKCSYCWLNGKNEDNSRYHVVSLAVGEKRILKVNFHANGNNDVRFVTIACKISYSDLLDNQYEQICHIEFKIDKSDIKYVSHGVTTPIEIIE